MATHDLELHHAAPRCLLTLHERANGSSLDGEGIGAWLSWEEEATRWSIPVEIARCDLQELVEASEVLLERKAHRLIHHSDWQRWGSRGGRETLRRYGTEWFALLALRRWGRVTTEDLEAARPLRWGVLLGRSGGTPGALKLLKEAGEDPLYLVARHRSGDWGELNEHDRRENELSLRHGWRLLSSYPVGEGKVWIITEADRSYTIILLPEEY